jgi:hypothetical protein
MIDAGCVHTSSDGLVMSAGSCAKVMRFEENTICSH